MDIILVSNRFAKARGLRLTGSHIFVAILAVLILFFTALFSAQYLIVRFHPDSLSSGVRSWLANVQSEEQLKQQTYLREGLNTMAIRLGQMQAQLLRLDSLGGKLAKMSGLKPQEFAFDQPSAQGGPYIPDQSVSQKNAFLDDINHQLSNLSLTLADRRDKLMVLETLLQQDRLDKKLFTSVTPVTDGRYSSNFGWRVDPFTGGRAMHEGVDFIKPSGAPIFAAAGGIVVFSELHPQYGNMIEIDHGNDVITRYAHASILIAKTGQVVRRGQEIA
ncbi:MAG: M23 family metallopeptidase, partial [Candidatus Nitrotoga sp.]